MSIAGRELLVFEVAGAHFCLPLSSVEEVVPASLITRVPSCPPFLLGLSAVRGRVMAVIDAARRYEMRPGLGPYFMVCQVRGNATAIVIDRPMVAGMVPVRVLDPAEVEALRGTVGIDAKFIQGGLELYEEGDGVAQARPRPTGTLCLEVDPGLFVSAEMASRVSEAA